VTAKINIAMLSPECHGNTRHTPGSSFVVSLARGAQDRARHVLERLGVRVAGDGTSSAWLEANVIITWKDYGAFSLSRSQAWKPTSAGPESYEPSCILS
jgi:hypothetical protein